MIAVIILAAGRSTRMGRPKALLPHTDPRTTILAHLIRSAHAAGAGFVLVVGRPDDQAVRMEAEREGAQFVTNPRAEDGQLSSVLAGLHATVQHAPDLTVGPARTPALAGVLVTPVDVPLVSTAVMAHLIERAGTSGAAILRATHANRHGHPVLFMREVFEELRKADPSVGAKAILRSRPDRV
ncbi:MAG TPA: nucleotidyltransferase family protein, partial [Vicinamibacterales bacterium]|nr:nucleotidyltransferase family protein [Vicinamibacterales bacterium]